MNKVLNYYVVVMFSMIVSMSIHKPFKSLYQYGDPLTILTADNFTIVTSKNDNVWFVEFYSSWCGHCMHFSPTWKSLGHSVEGWSSVIRIAAIDCAVEENFSACQEQNITAYPTLQFYGAYGSKNGLVNLYDSGRKLTSLQNGMVEFVEVQSAENRPHDWPKLHVLQTLSDIWNDLTPEIKFTILIVEDEKSYIGRKVILDLCSYKDVLVRRIFKSALSYTIKNVPSMYDIDQKGSFKLIAVQNNTYESFSVSIKEYLELQNDSKTINIINDEDSSKIEYGSNKTSEDKNTVGIKDGQVHYNRIYIEDLESGIMYALSHEVALHSVIEGELLDTLKKFLYVLCKYFKGRSYFNLYICNLNSWINEGRESIQSKEWLETLNEYQHGSPFFEKTWITCAGSSLIYRGYTCSLWTLFHVLSVSEYEIRQDGNQTRSETLLLMDLYIKNYFGCEDCSKHFSMLTKSANFDDMSLDDAIIWLWRTHNKVNRRIKGDISEDPSFPKIQYPPSSLCGECRKGDLRNTQWNIHAVLNFLKFYYSPNSIIYSHEINSIDYGSSYSYDDPKTSSYLGFNKFDVSICYALYIFSIILMLIAYKKFCFHKCRLLRTAALNKSTTHYLLKKV